MSRNNSTIEDDTHYITTGYSGDIVFSSSGGRIVSLTTGGTFTELMSYGVNTSLGYIEGSNKIIFGGVFFIYSEDFSDHASIGAKEIFIRCIQWRSM